MSELVFRDFNDATGKAIPSVVGLDTAGTYCIGEPAMNTASLGRPVIQDFKKRIGESDALYLGTRSDALWPLRPGITGKDGSVSTEEVARVFFKDLFGKVGTLPRQLVIGIPASTDEAWQRYYRSHLAKLFGELGFPDPKFFPEPFAVFQYYRHCEKLIPDVDHSQNVLVIDAGGGTFDCCAIQTTVRGNLARRGTTANPLGIKSVSVAGKHIDRWLLERALSKINSPILKKESPSARLLTHPYALFAIEQMKITLSDQLHASYASLTDDCNHITATGAVAKGLYHPDLALNLVLTGEDLKTVIVQTWKEHWGPTILGTLKDVQFRGGKMSIDTIDKVILAGGSSHLAFIQQLVAKTLAGQINFHQDDIVIGGHFEKAVAFGLAVEAREQRNTALRTHDSIGPCIFNPLYLRVASDRSSGFIRPSVRLKGKPSSYPDGVLLDGPVQVADDFSLEFEITLPFRPKKYFIYKFYDSPVEALEDSAVPLNLEDDVVRVPINCPATFSLVLGFGEDGLVRPEFRFDEFQAPARDFFFGGLQISREVESYAGIDFGTSNTYVVNLWSEAISRDIDYPIFTLSESAGNQIRLLEKKLIDYQSAKLLDSVAVKKLYGEQRAAFIFNSIKIEGSKLTKGETEGALSGIVPISTNELKEPVNVARGYDFVLENAHGYREAPEAFLRHLNKIMLDGISDGAGDYRTDSVKLAGMDFEPPPAISVAPYMERLAQELKEGAAAKSAIHFAAEAHAKFTAIHPFEDGNGRTARLLVNAILIDAGLCPVVVEFTDKERYLDCLKASNAKDISLMCMFFSELVEQSLALIAPEPISAQEPGIVPAIEAAISEIPGTPVPAVPMSASQRLAEAVRRKVEARTTEREARYKAWSAAFENFKQELDAAAISFNEVLAKTSPFSIRVTMFDTLPFEKYESIIRGTYTPKTWLTGCQITSDLKRENFVFFFQGLSHHFSGTAREQALTLPIRDVSLAISRWSDAMYRRLLDEPISLREIAYADGQLLFLIAGASGQWQIKSSPISEIVNDFFADAVEAFL